ncbi:hypothetical protein BDV96DRAFT_478010, partial [Lophiotrema nucula]
MTEISSVKAHAEPQPASVAFFGGPAPPPFLNGSPSLDDTVEEEESSTIKCICGFPEDDGNTVLCEKCNTWQHIVCYYESTQHVPDIHECTDCFPRTVDAKKAAERQRLRLELHSIGERKLKPKPPTKGHKKRIKDPLSSVQPNGAAIHANNELLFGHDRKSGSPRDQPPPAKRPKTSHKTSVSVNMISQVPALVPGSRKRASSAMHNGHSPVKSPTILDPVDEYSTEFLSLYRQPEPALTNSNSYTDIGVANEISLWLNDREALAEATGGKTPGEVLQRIDLPVDELEDMAPNITKRIETGPLTPDGAQPQWQYLVVDSFVPKDAYIGELKGRIGRKADYFSDPSNRWDLLRHPEPFVFFPPHLPIYIDMREEGNILRYTRRSCNPNIGMKMLTQGPESGYHFCFIAIEDIHPDDELTVGWEIGPDIYKHLEAAMSNGAIRKEGFKKIEPWIACVLSNFGGCACDASRGHNCLLEHARRANPNHTDSVPPQKKGRRKKNAQVSPLSTGHATNSRAGSEAFIREGPDDEAMDSRSTSGSHSKPSSRDITPATHFSLSLENGDLKMSDRERRKLQQQERLFEQLEYDEQNKGKRKRHSAGSALNTPSLATSVRLFSRPSLFETDILNQKQLGHSELSPSIRNPREHANGVARKTSGNSTRTNGRTALKPKPLYVDSCTQTQDDKAGSTAPASAAPVKREMRPIMSFKRKLLQQAQEDRLQRERMRSASVKVEARSPALKDLCSGLPSPAPQPIPSVETAAMDIATDPAMSPSVKEQTPGPSADVEMKDADAATSPKPSEPQVEEMSDVPNGELSTAASHPPLQPPPPPWPTTSTAAGPDEQIKTPVDQLQNPEDLHIPIPPPDLSNAVLPTNSVVTPGSVSSVLAGSAIAQSPVSTATALSPFSPSVTNAVTPGPIRKKLSLSDYTSRRAKLAQTHSTGSN